MVTQDQAQEGDGKQCTRPCLAHRELLQKTHSTCRICLEFHKAQSVSKQDTLGSYRSTATFLPAFVITHPHHLGRHDTMADMPPSLPPSTPQTKKKQT